MTEQLPDSVDENEDENPKNLPRPIEGQILPLEDLPPELRVIYGIEMQRLAVQRRRDEIMREAIRLDAEDDERQYQYYIEKLRTEERIKAMSHKLIRNVVYIGGISFLLITMFVLGMAFFGEEPRSRIALDMLSSLGKVVAGVGIYYIATRIWRRLGK